MRRLIHVALSAPTFSVVVTTGHARLASSDDTVESATIPLLGTWIVDDPRLDPDAPVVIAFGADGSAVQLGSDGAARMGRWFRVDDSTAMAELAIPDTQLTILITVDVAAERLTGDHSLVLSSPAADGSGTLVRRVYVPARRFTSTRLS